MSSVLAPALSRVRPRFHLRFSDLPVTEDALKVLQQKGLLTSSKPLRKKGLAVRFEDMDSAELEALRSSSNAAARANISGQFHSETVNLTREEMRKRLDALTAVQRATEAEKKKARGTRRLQRAQTREAAIQRVLAEASGDSSDSSEDDCISQEPSVQDLRRQANAARSERAARRRRVSREASVSPARGRSPSKRRRAGAASGSSSNPSAVEALAASLVPALTDKLALMSATSVPPRKQFGASRDMSTVQCYRCFQYGHFARNCPVANSAGSGPKAFPASGELFCTFCRTSGHDIWHCPRADCKKSAAFRASQAQMAASSVSGSRSFPSRSGPGLRSQRVLVYCEICKRLGTHSTDRCFYHPDKLRAMGITVNVPNPRSQAALTQANSAPLNSVSQSGMRLAGTQQVRAMGSVSVAGVAEQPNPNSAPGYSWDQVCQLLSAVASRPSNSGSFSESSAGAHSSQSQ